MKRSSREWRILILPAIAAYLLFFGVKEQFSRHPSWGVRIILLGCLIVTVAQWLMDREDQQFLEEEEARVAENPKHLFNSDVGFRFHPERRQQIGYGMISSGLGVLIYTFERSFAPPHIFAGVLLVILGFIVLFWV